MDVLTLHQANELIRLAIAKTISDYQRPVCVAICDATGALLAFQRMDGAPLRSVALSQGKAYSAARMQVNTDAFLSRMHRENITPQYFCDDKLTALPGGSVLKTGTGVIVGAIGISGLTSEEDQAVANAMCHHLLDGPS